MSYTYITQVPNILFDQHLQHLGYAELKVLLVIIRQTYGWIDKRTNKRKRWDWISQQFFSKKTGLSKRAVSNAIAKLLEKKLINVKDEQGREVQQAIERQRKSKLYYSCTFVPLSSELRSS